jgi:hypothetical protein
MSAKPFGDDNDFEVPDGLTALQVIEHNIALYRRKADRSARDCCTKPPHSEFYARDFCAFDKAAEVLTHLRAFILSRLI